LMRSAPVELCDTAEIAAAVSSSSLSLATRKTLTRWPLARRSAAAVGSRRDAS
jgi:hypothetical protein